MTTKTLYQIDVSTTVLIIVDPQRAFGQGPVLVPCVEMALQKMRVIINAWRTTRGRIIVTRHTYRTSSDVGRVIDFIPRIYEVLRASSSGAEFHPGILCDVNSEVIEKTEFNPFIGTNLEPLLHHMGMDTLVICGLTTPICVEGAVRGAHERGFKVVLLSDACASQAMGKETAEQAHQSAIGRMGYVFADVLTTAEFLQRLGHKPTSP